MKNKSIIVYSIFACLIYIFSLTYFAFNLAYEFSNGESRTRRRFDHTATTIQESIKQINNSYYDANSIKKIITSSFGSMNDFAYIELSENGKTIYCYKTNTLENGSTSKLLRNYSNTFRVGDKEYFFTANLYNLRPTSIFIYGKRSFLVILIVTIITFILIIVSNFKTVHAQNYEEQIESNKDDFEENLDEETAPVFEESEEKEIIQSEAEKNNENITDDSTEESSGNNENDITEIKTENENNSVSEEVIENENTSEPILSEIESTVSAENNEIAAPTPSADTEEIEYATQQELPEGIYSPETGLSYEPFLETKLNNEINRSIASEADLSLFLIEIPEVEKSSELFKQICNYLILQFQYKELVFEYKSNLIAAIKINSTIDEAITFADKIHSDIKNIINDDNIDCYIGITSRTIRMVSAERLLLEADEALEHSKEDKKCPIIAFRADAEKFRLANL